MSGNGMAPEGALGFVERHGIVLESGSGPVPSLVEAIVGSPIRGSWWGHPKGKAIFRASRMVRESSDVLVCRLIDAKITYVHCRLWPALVCLADEIGPTCLDAIREEHTTSGTHKLVTTAFPRWVPPEVRAAAAKLSATDARSQIGDWLTPEVTRKSRAKARVRAKH
jgi:hypothetical protein